MEVFDNYPIETLKVLLLKKLAQEFAGNTDIFDALAVKALQDLLIRKLVERYARTRLERGLTLQVDLLFQGGTDVSRDTDLAWVVREFPKRVRETAQLVFHHTHSKE
jgi:hypothetical protein